MESGGKFGDALVLNENFGGKSASTTCIGKGYTENEGRFARELERSRVLFEIPRHVM